MEDSFYLLFACKGLVYNIPGCNVVESICILSLADPSTENGNLPCKSKVRKMRVSIISQPVVRVERSIHCPV